MRFKGNDNTGFRVCALAAIILAACLLMSSCSGVSGIDRKAKVESSLDYSRSNLWACYNDDGGTPKEADCFIISPTVYVAGGRDNNLNVKDPSARRLFINGISDQTGLYSDHCALYSPFYSQASIEVYSMESDEAAGYFDIAYADVENAFLYYLKNCNRGRPLVLAGFSQGADMCIRLLKDHGNDPAVRKILVACYAIGWRVTSEDVAGYPHLKPAQSENDTGVIITFDCEAEDVKSSLVVPEGAKTYSINPLNWRTDETPADRTLNKGALMNDGSIKAGLTGCYINKERGTLKVTDIAKDDYPPGPSCFSEGEYHIYDFRLFYRNLQENVSVRISAFIG